MALLSKFNSKIKDEINTGFGSNASNYGGRFLNKDGSANIRKTGVGILERFSWFHSMLSFSRTKFFLIILVFYIGINLLFTLIYYSIGAQNLAGITVNDEAKRFYEEFFFSTQTFTTVGYGRISPVGFLTSAVAALEALIGLMSFALVTGLLYGRFSRPRAYLKFAANAIIAPYKDITGLMIRLAPFKNTPLTDAVAKLTVVLITEENGKLSNKFFNLDLELITVNTLTLSWTLVHPITEDSPFYHFKENDYTDSKGEIIVFIKAFDDMFSNTVVSRTSYLLKEVVYGARFIPMFHRDDTNDVTILDLEKISRFEKINLPEREGFSEIPLLL